jgi:hypothetical protein
MTKEEVYDAEINPLMAKIIEICKREKIAALCNFHLGGDLACTTSLLAAENKPSKDQLSALSMLRDGFVAFAITTRKKS